MGAFSYYHGGRRHGRSKGAAAAAGGTGVDFAFPFRRNTAAVVGGAVWSTAVLLRAVLDAWVPILRQGAAGGAARRGPDGADDDGGEGVAAA